MANGTIIHASWYDTGVHCLVGISFWVFGYEEEAKKPWAMEELEQLSNNFLFHSLRMQSGTKIEKVKEKRNHIYASWSDNGIYGLNWSSVFGSGYEGEKRKPCAMQKER